MENVIKFAPRAASRPPVDGATPWFVNGRHCGWIMPQVTVPPITQKYRQPS